MGANSVFVPPAPGATRAAHVPAEVDPRNKLYRIRTVVDGDAPARAKRRWKPGLLLNQGTTNLCTGFAFTGWLMSRPYGADFDKHEAKDYAGLLVHDARELGNTDPRGGARIGDAAQVLVNRGILDAYAFAETIGDVRDAILEVGPVVIGVAYLPSMAFVSRGGNVRVRRGQIGYGHAMLVNGYHPDRGFRLRNSFGTDWGKPHRATNLGNGHGWIRESDLEWLLFQHENYPGTACLPLGTP